MKSIVLEPMFVHSIYLQFVKNSARLFVLDDLKCIAYKNRKNRGERTMGHISKSHQSTGPFVRRYGLFTIKLKGVFR